MNFNDIYENYHALIPKVLTHLNLTRTSTYLDYDDFYQLACIALWQSSLSYPKPLESDPEGFFKYSFIFIKHQLIDTLRTMNTHYQEVPLSTELPPWELIPDLRVQPLADYYTYQEIVSKLPNPLTKKQYNYVLLHFIYGLSLTEIAAFFHVSKQTVFQWKKGALKKIKDYFLSDTD